MADAATKSPLSDRPAKEPDGHLARRRRWLLTVASTNVLLVMASMVALNAALADVAVETSATQTQLTWIVDGYTLALACLLLPAGALGDRYGRRGALLAGLLIFTAASAAPIIWDDPWEIVAARAVAGAGAAFIMPATLSLLTSAYPRDERNKAVGIWAGVAGSGAIFGFLGAGVLLAFFSWQSIFYGFAGAGLMMLGSTFTIGSSRDETATPIDWRGAVAIGGAIGIFVLGIVQAPVRGWTDTVVVGSMIASLLLVAAFTRLQLRTPHPLLDVRLFADPSFGGGAAAITVLFFAMFGFFFLVMQFMQLVMDYSALQTAAALSPLAIPMLALSSTIHLFLPKIGLRFALSTGLCCLAAGLLWMTTLDSNATFVDLVGPLVVSSLGLGFVMSPATSAIMTATPDEKQGVASAVNDAAREVGAAIGIAVAGSILAAGYRDALASTIGALPADARDAAVDSLAAAQAVAATLGPRVADLANLAEAAFMDAMNQALYAMSATLFAGAVLVAALSPGRNGKPWVSRRQKGRHRAPKRWGQQKGCRSFRCDSLLKSVYSVR